MASEPRTYVYGEWMATLVRWATLILAFLLNNVVGGTGPMESTLQNALILVGAILNLILTLALWRGFQPTRRFCRLSVVLDILFLSLIIYLRGGLFSTTYVLYFPVIFATAIRFGLSESLLYALLIDITYAGVVLAAEPGGPGALSSLGWAQLIIRVLVLAGAAGISGLLADREKALRAQWIASDRRATEAQRQLQELSMVQEINQLILQHPSDLGRVLAGVSQVVQSRLDCTLVSICLSQPGGAETDSYYVSDGNTDAPRPLRYPLAAGIGYQVFQTGEALNVPDVTQHPGYEAVFAQTRAELCVPMRIKDRVLGVIEAISEQPHVFGASDERVLSIVAGQAAMAVENAHLFTASQRQVAELTILNQIGQALGTTLHQDELLELIYQQASRVMDTRNFYIAMYDEATESVSFPLAVRDGQRQQWRTYRRRNGPAEYVVRQRQSLLIAREVAQRFQELGIDFPGQIPNSWLGVPMVVGDQVLGVMALQSHEPGHSYDQDHQRLLATIAGQAAVALENTRLYAETRRQAERSIILKWVSTMVDAFADPQGALDGIAASTRTALGCSSAVILAREPGRSALSLVAAQGITTAQREQLQQWAPDPDSPTATLTGTRWSIEDVRTQSLAGAPWTDFENWQAWAEVPLRGRQEILGCLLTGYEQPHHLTEQEDELLVALAAQAAVALETARLMQKTERRARELSTLYEVGQIITSSLDLDTVLDRIMHQAVDLLEVEAGSLVLVDRASGELVFRIALGTKGSQVQGLRLPPGTGVVGQVAITGDPVCVNDAQRDPRFYPGTDAASGFNTRSILAVPLISHEQTIGVIEVMNRQDNRPFLLEHLDLLTAFAAQAAIAVENAQLYQRTDEALARRVHELTTIAEVDHQLAATLDFEHVNDLVIEGAMQATNASAALVALLDETGQNLLLMSQRGYPPEIRRYQFEPWPVNRGIIGYVARTGQPALLGDVQQAPDYVAVIPTTRSQLSVPILREEGQVIGAVALESSRQNAFSAEDLRFVQHLAEHAGIAMQNARLFAELQRANRELQALSDAKTEFVSIVSHELRTPMTSIKGYVDLILEDEQVDEEVREFLQVVQENTDRLAKLVADLLDISRIEAGRIRLSCQPMSLVDVTDLVVDTLTARILEKQLRLTVAPLDDVPLVWGDRDRVTQIMLNLVSNAVKYTPAGGSVHIAAQSVDEGVQVAVSDTGIGISVADQAHLFENFFRADHPLVRQEPGTGLGLSIVKSLVELHGGRVWVDSQVDEGSTFYFTLPVNEPSPAESLGEAA